MSSSPSTLPLSERLSEREAELSSCQDEGRLLARVRSVSPQHPVLAIRFLSLWIAVVAVGLSLLLAVMPATLAEFDALGWSAAGILEGRLNHLNRLASLPLDLPLVPSMLGLIAACAWVIRMSMHALVLTLGQTSELLDWEASELEAIHNAKATLLSDELASAKRMPPLDLETLDWAGSGEPLGATPIEPERVGALQRTTSSPRLPPSDVEE